MVRLRSLLVILAVVLLGLPACGDSGSGAGGNERTVLIDFNHDEFAGSFLQYFPRQLKVHPGATVKFKQAWTGEPHSVTFGKAVTDAIAPLNKYLVKGPPYPEDDQLTEEETGGLEGLEKLPFMLDREEGGDAAQNGAQPCELQTGVPPEDTKTPCTAAQRKLGEFDGTENYYNSGFIPYQGNNGNQFEMKLADDIKPGDYFYYCNYHFIEMSGYLTVEDEAKDIPSQSQVDRQARAQVQKIATQLLDVKKKAEQYVKTGKAPKDFEVPDAYKDSRQLAGMTLPNDDFRGFVSEFIPGTTKAKVGEKVTWAFVGGHTVSFDVPKYFPQFTVAKDGTVKVNKKAYGNVNSPDVPNNDDEDEEGPPEAPPPPPTMVDGGTFDGSGYKSSGVMGDAFYSVTFTKPGRYKYACAIHPRMVGEITVS